MLRLFIVLVLLALFVVGVFYFAAQAFGAMVFNTSSKAWMALLDKLRQTLNTLHPGPLNPCTEENIAQLGLNPKVLKKSGWPNGAFSGLFSTIYPEPLLVYAGHKSGKSVAVVAKTADKEFVFRKKEKEIEIWVNGQPYAVLAGNVLLESGKQGRLLAKLEEDPDLRHWPVLMGNTESVNLNNPDRVISPIPRALTLLRPLKAEEEQVILVLTVIKGLRL